MVRGKHRKLSPFVHFRKNITEKNPPKRAMTSKALEVL
ncbi:hypothetical protein LEP1GSC137_3816 [Leptospira borgpetersenii str. Noumea 25]|nr:hypothetical protein LEP1GSC137_3816 [Leptospira borgpetersenii str. Noumea 25]